MEKIFAAKNAKDAKKNLTQRRRGAEAIKESRLASNVSRPVEDTPFDIPESWEWVRLGEVASVERGSGIKRSETSSDGFPCVRYGEIYTSYGYSFTNTKSFVPEQVADSCHLANHGDVLCTLTGEWKEEIAKATAYLGNASIAIGGDLAKISSVVFSPVLLVYFFFAPFMIQQKASKANGTMIVHIGKDAICNLLIPLPPLAEQKRIVAKIEELLPLIDRYEKAWSRLEDFNKRFPVDMQKSLLQLAIQGKLVEQRPEEGTAAELLEKILAAKNAKDVKGVKKNLTQRRGVRGGKATSAPSVSPREKIPDDEKPFDIPESWEWVRLGEIGSWASGATPSRTHAEYFGGNIPWLKTGDLTDGYVSSTPETITELALAKTSVRLNPVGSVLMAMYGATIGKLGILQIAATTNQACCACIPHDGVWNKYLFYYLMARRKDFVKMGEGGAQPNISKEKIVNSIIPLPPLAEQKRIVAKIEELLPLIGRYEKAWSKLEDFNKRFPVDMQKSLLQMAIQGKLVEQYPEEGTAAELVEKITRGDAECA